MSGDKKPPSKKTILQVEILDAEGYKRPKRDERPAPARAKDDPRLTPSEKLVLLAMVDRHFPDCSNWVYEGAPKIAKRTALSVATVRQVRARLVAAGWLVLDGRTDEDGRPIGGAPRAARYKVSTPPTIGGVKPLEGSNEEGGPLQPLAPTPPVARPELDHEPEEPEPADFELNIEAVRAIRDGRPVDDFTDAAHAS